jgi:cell division protein FtsB
MINVEVLNPLRWNRTFLLSILVAFLLLWIGFLDNYSLWARYQLSREKSDLESRIEQLREETKELEGIIEALQNDPAYLEKVAREEYGMRKPGETVYQIREK